MPASPAMQGPMTSFVPAFALSRGSAAQSPATGLTSCTPIGPPDSCQIWLAAPLTQPTSRSGVPGAVLPPAGARHLPPELIAPSGSMIHHCCVALGVLELPVAFDLAWQTAATARTPFRVPVSVRHLPLLRFLSTAFEPSCHR